VFLTVPIRIVKRKNEDGQISFLTMLKSATKLRKLKIGKDGCGKYEEQSIVAGLLLLLLREDTLAHGLSTSLFVFKAVGG